MLFSGTKRSKPEALDEQSIAYEVIAGPWRPKHRAAVIHGTGQRLYPAIRFEDGGWYRDESKEMARTISGGLLLNQGSSLEPDEVTCGRRNTADPCAGFLDSEDRKKYVSRLLDRCFAYSLAVGV